MGMIHDPQLHSGNPIRMEKKARPRLWVVMGLLQTAVRGGTHSVQQEADTALDQLHHAMDVQHRLFVPLAEIRTDLRLQVG